MFSSVVIGWDKNSRGSVASGSDNIYRSIEVRCYPNLERLIHYSEFQMQTIEYAYSDIELGPSHCHIHDCKHSPSHLHVHDFEHRLLHLHMYNTAERSSGSRTP